MALYNKDPPTLFCAFYNNGKCSLSALSIPLLTKVFTIEMGDEQGDEEIEALIAERTEARKNKDWATADRIRDELKARHIVIEDTPQGIKWKYEE